MHRIISAVLSLFLAVPPALFAQTTAPGPQDKEARLKQLAELLKSFSDDDYQLALSQLPDQNKNTQLVSRGAVLKSVYNSLAAFEYEQAGRKVETAPAAGGVQEAGQATDVLKWLANATLNYWLKGGQTYVGREISTDSETAKIDSTLVSLDTQLVGGSLDAQKKAGLHLEKAKLYEKLAAAPLETESDDERTARKAERIKKLAALLKSVTDEDYATALQSLPEEASASKSRLADRRQVLRSSYLSLAALEYRRDAKKEGSLSSSAYKRLLQDHSETLVVNPETLQETGWAMDMAKWLGNAALNYWLHGGEDFVNRGFEPGGEKGKFEKSVESGETETGAALDHYQLGQAYEQLAAAAIEPASAEQTAAIKKERLKKLAELLQSVSEEDYQDTLALIPEDSPARPHLASRRKVLKSAYVTLAALEYKDAGRSSDLERLSRDEKESLVIQPQTLQETGWGKKLLGVAALGGIGYAVYKNQESLGIRPRRRAQPNRAPAATTPTEALPAEKPKPKCSETLGCDGVQSHKCPGDGSVDIIVMPAQCAKPPECPGPRCASSEEACPKGRFDNDGYCSNKCSKGNLFVDGQCIAYTRPIRCEGSLKLPSGIPFCHNTVCAEGHQAYGAVCFAKRRQDPQKCPPGYVWGRDPLWMPAPIPPCGPRLSKESCENRTEAFQKHNRNDPRCIKENLRTPNPRGPRMHCMAYIPACGYPELKTGPIAITKASAQIGDLYGALEAEEARLAGVSREQSAEVHGKMGAIYEQLASEYNDAPPTQAPPAPKDQPPAPAPEDSEPPQPEPKAAPRVKKPLPSKEDMLQSEMKDMDDMEKKMRQEVERRRTDE